MILQARGKYPQDKLYGKAIMRVISYRLVEPVRSHGDHVHAYRVTWRSDCEGLAHAWDDIVSQRRLCDEIVSRTPSLQMFVSCISGMYNTGRILQELVNPVYPAVSYWAVFSGTMAQTGLGVQERLSATCPTAQVRSIKSLRVRQDPEAASCGTLYTTLKDHSSDFVCQRICRSLVACGQFAGSSQPVNAKVFVGRHSRYLHDMEQSLARLTEVGLFIVMEVFDESLPDQDVL